MSFTDPELVQSESFDMDRQQMYKESRIQDFMWTDERGMLVYNNSLSLIEIISHTFHFSQWVHFYTHITQIMCNVLERPCLAATSRFTLA